MQRGSQKQNKRDCQVRVVDLLAAVPRRMQVIAVGERLEAERRSSRVGGSAAVVMDWLRVTRQELCVCSLVGVPNMWL